MGKGSSNSTDVVGAAATEGEYSRQTARDKTYADRPDQYGPFGSTTWEQSLAYDPAASNTYSSWEDRDKWGPYEDGGGGGSGGGHPRLPPRDDGGSGTSRKNLPMNDQGGGGVDDDGRVTKWTQRNTLNEEAQRYFDSQMGRNNDLAALSEGMGGRIQDEMGDAPDWEQFGDVHGFDPTQNRQDAEDAAYGRSTQRLDPRFERQRATLERQMAGRGLRAGDSAYDSAMSNFNTGRNDAYEMARMGSVGEGRQEVGLNLQTNERANALRRQQIEEYIGKRGYSLSESERLADAQNMEEMASTFGGGG